MSARLEECGVELLIENHDRFRASDLKRILQQAGRAPLGICLDTVNSLAVPETVEQLMDALGPWIGNVHLKDFSVRRIENRMGFVVEGAALGSGRLDMSGVLAAALSLPRDPTFVLEQWPPRRSDISATIECERSSAHESIANLRARIAGIGVAS